MASRGDSLPGDILSSSSDCLPEDTSTLSEVLLRVPGQDMGKRWKTILDVNALRKDKSNREYYDTDQLLTLLASSDFKEWYSKNPYNRNLIKNSNAAEGLQYWDVKKNGGDGFKREPVPIGCHPLSNYTTTDTTAAAAAAAKGAVVSCWATSYGDCRKEQVIDLIKRGCSEYVLDNIKPDICVSEWYAGRRACGMEYMLEVQLLKRKNDSKPIAKWSFTDTKPAGEDWFSAGTTISNYSSGLRYIKYIHSGKDTQHWAGHFGAKFTLSTVKFDFTHTAGPN